MIEWEDGTAVRYVSSHYTYLMAYIVYTQGKERCQIWARPLQDGSVAVALFNSVSTAWDIVCV